MSDQAEPGSTKDVSEIVKAFSLGLGPDAPASSDPHFLASYHGINPDAICGERCRHATNPRFLSTRGIQIALARFDKIKVDFTSGTRASASGVELCALRPATGGYVPYNENIEGLR